MGNNPNNPHGDHIDMDQAEKSTLDFLGQMRNAAEFAKKTLEALPSLNILEKRIVEIDGKKIHVSLRDRGAILLEFTDDKGNADDVASKLHFDTHYQK